MSSDVIKIQKTRVADKSGQNQINVVSKRNVKVNSSTHAKLKEKFDKAEQWRLDKEQREQNNTTTSPDQMDDDISRDGMVANSDWVVLVTHINVFLYAACFFIQTGTLPYLTKQLGADAVLFGKLQTAFAVCQLIGGPIYGRLGDRFGEKFVMSLAFLSAFLSYLLTGLSNSILMLFCSRIPSVLMHVMQGSQMIVTRMTSQNARAGSLARLGFSYGLGMVVGPTLGGYVTSNFGEQASALLASFGMLISLVLVLVFVPDIKYKSPDKDDEKSGQPKTTGMQEINKMLSLTLLPGARSLLFIKTLTGIPLAIFQSMFSVMAVEIFQLPADQNGLLMSYIGVLSLLMQGAGVSLVTSRLSDIDVLKFTAFTLAASYYTTVYLNGLTDFLLLLIPMVFSLTLVNAIITSSLTKVVTKSDTGSILGLNMAVNSVLRTVSPTVGGWMMTNYGFWSIGLLGLVCNVSVLVFLRLFGLKTLN